MTAEKRYKNTVSLPRTSFPMKGDLPRREPERLRAWAEEGLAELLRKKRQGQKPFILHDGPPYANGPIHIGHALNKILKDIIVTYKLMRGFDARFVPGWDCHGLPIEHAALKEMGKRKEEVGQLEFRRKARAYAEKYIHIQREEFIRLGVFGEWEKPYLTMSYDYQAAIAEAFLTLYEKGYIEHRLKPVPWCAECETALADAELEYDDRDDDAIYVTFSNYTPPPDLILPGEEYPPREAPFSFLVWTTTPWTLPANVGLAVHPDLDYVFAITDRGRFIFAEKLLESVASKLGFKQSPKITRRVRGSELQFATAGHPFVEQRSSKVIRADFVSASEGTGVVHIAPGHGEEDYQVGHLQNGLEILSPVDEKGRFTDEFPLCKGQNVFKANPRIVELLKEKGALVHAENYPHAYPHCWRCKKPVIFRATRQWFLKIDAHGLRGDVLREIQKAIAFYPDWGKNRIGAMVETRPDWCLSRQRYWGVPIPILTCKSCGQHVAFKDKVIKLFRGQGADVWFSEPAGAFLPDDYSCGACHKKEFEKQQDILDVWFDSGVSHQAVLKRYEGLSFPADLYLEGSDQHRGWFQVSLITAAALDHQTPFRAVLTHGFVVDGEGKKMSKSAGNVISPQEVLKAFGADPLRLWVSSCDYQFDVRLSKEILERMVEAYRRVRNTFKFLLGNLYDFDPARAVPVAEMDSLDQWAVAKTQELVRAVTEAYETYRFHQIYRLVTDFCATELSSFYLDVLKDCLYVEAPEGRERRASQTVLHIVWQCLAKILAPILPFTADEAWRAFAGPRESVSVFEASWPSLQFADVPADLLGDWDALLQVRRLAAKRLEGCREQGIIGSSLEAHVTLRTASQELLGFLKSHSARLAKVFIVSAVHLGEGAGDSQVTLRNHPYDIGVEVARADGSKCERCWNWRPTVGENRKHPSLCRRCVDIVERMFSESRS